MIIFTIADCSRLLQPGGPVTRIYISLQEQGSPLTTLVTGFPFRRYSNGTTLGALILHIYMSVWTVDLLRSGQFGKTSDPYQ